MRSPFLPASRSLTFLITALALSAGCGETFVAGSGGSGGGTTTSGGGTASSPTTGGSVTSSAGGSGGSTGTAPSCAPLAADLCSVCLSESCTGRYCGCIGDDACLGYLECLAEDDPPLDPSWFEKCWQQHPGSASKAGMLSVCAKAKCEACDTSFLTDCLACQYESCPEEVDACFQNGFCTTFLTCAKNCKDTGGGATCIDACNDAAGEFLYLAQDLVDCAQASCAAACPVANE